MGAFVIEIQGNAILSYYHNEEEVQRGIASQDYYQKCSYAAVSNVPLHVVMLLEENGNILKQERFYHPLTEETTNEE